MHTFLCTRCDITYSDAEAEVVSTHATSEGWIAYLRCPQGHLSVRTLALEVA